MPSSEVLVICAEMTGVEASENACLVFRGADDASQQSLSHVRKTQLGSDQKLMQVRYSPGQFGEAPAHNL